MSRRNNSRKHGVYQVEKASRGAAVLDKRTWQARFVRDLKEAVAQDLGFSSSADMPRLKSALVERACYKVLMCMMIEGQDPEKLTATMREDYFKFSAGLLRYAALIGTDRLQKDVTPTLAAIRDSFTVEHGEEEG